MSPATLRLLVAGFVALLLNSAYLAALPSASLWYFANVAAHPLLGLGLAGIAALALLRRRWTPPPLCAAGLGVSAIGLLLGLGVAAVGATRAQRPLLVAHVTVMVVGAALLAAHLWRSAAGNRAVAGNGALKRALRAGLAVVLLAAIAAPFVRSATDAEWRRSHRIVNPTSPPVSMDDEGRGPDSPFFPSSADTNVRDIIPADFFLTSEACGRCHKDIYEEWNASAHHFSSFNNQWYRKSIEYMQDVVGTKPSKWCAGCHDHAVFFNGRFDRPIREQIDTPEAQAGLGCTSCHSIVHVGSTMGQGDFVIEYPPLHDLAASENPLLQWLHDTATYLAPESAPEDVPEAVPHRAERRVLLCRATRCTSTSRSTSTAGCAGSTSTTTGRRPASPARERGRSTTRRPPRPAATATCRSSRPTIRRRATAWSARTASPAPTRRCRSSTATRSSSSVVQDFLRDGQVSVDVFGIARVAEAPPPDLTQEARGTAEPRLSSTFAVGEESMRFGAAGISAGGPPAEVLAPLDLQPVAVRRGESVRVEVVVRTRKVGHFFPGGTVDAFDVWVELEAVDERGRVLLHSGAAADGGSGPVDPSAHFYRSLQLDERGNPINKRNAWMTRSVAYVRLIPPGAADTIHYRLQVPEDAGDRITLRAKVNYRKFAWWNTQWAYAGERVPSTPDTAVGSAYDDGQWTFTGDTSDVSGGIKAIPDIPTTVMAEAEASLVVIDADAPLPPPPSQARTQHRRPGPHHSANAGTTTASACCCRATCKGAVAAFEHVMEIEPTYPDGPVNVARALLQEGDVDRCDSLPRAGRRPGAAPRARALLPRNRAQDARRSTTRRCPIWRSRASSTRGTGWCWARSAASSSSTGASTKRSRPSRRSCGSIRKICRPTTT